MLMALSCGDAFALQKGGEDAPAKVEAKADTAVSVADSVKGEMIDDALLGDAEESALDSALVADANAGTYSLRVVPALCRLWLLPLFSDLPSA